MRFRIWYWLKTVRNVVQKYKKEWSQYLIQLIRHLTLTMNKMMLYSCSVGQLSHCHCPKNNTTNSFPWVFYRILGLLKWRLLLQWVISSNMSESMTSKKKIGFMIWPSNEVTLYIYLSWWYYTTCSAKITMLLDTMWTFWGNQN